MKDREKIEKLLENYRSIRSNIEIELNKKYPEYSLDSVSFVKTGADTNEIKSQVENYIVDKYSISDDLHQKIQVVNIIKAAYNSLNEEQKKIVADLYFEGRGVKATAAGSGWSRYTIKRRKEKILDELKGVGILNAWDIWKNI